MYPHPEDTATMHDLGLHARLVVPSLIVSLGLALGVLGAPREVAAEQGLDPASYTALEWRHIGPEGNRFSAAAGISGDAHTYYVGAASGGIYKTTDGGVHWAPIFDDQPVQSIGALAVAPSDPNIVWAGTGEGKIRSHVSIGQGIYKSMDAGETWTLMGLEATGRIPRLVIHPTDPDVVYVCALGHAYGPQPERGVYRTMDGGASWERILFVNQDTGCSDLAMDPSNPGVLFAGTWQLEIRTWGRTSGGPGGALHVSRDGGDTWTLPERTGQRHRTPPQAGGQGGGRGGPVQARAHLRAPGDRRRHSMGGARDGRWPAVAIRGRGAPVDADHPQPQRHGTAPLLLPRRGVAETMRTRPIF